MRKGNLSGVLSWICWVIRAVPINGEDMIIQVANIARR
jgi:hypothetical protein